MPMMDSEPAPERALQTVHALADAQVVLASSLSSWASVAATRFRMGKVDISLPALGVPAFGVNYGQRMQLKRTLRGRTVGARAVAGHLSLLPPDAETRWVFDQPGDVALVFLNRQLFRRAIEECAGCDPGSVEITPKFVIRDLVLERVAHRLLKEISQPGAASRLLTEELAQELATYLISAHSNVNLQRVGRSHTMAPSKLKRAKEFMLANLQSKVSLLDIASAAGMSLFHFAKAFRQATGQAPHQYLTVQRLLQARALLHDEGLSIAEVASSVGLSHSRFTAVFTRRMGMTPSAFRGVLYS
jgi:AraC family transcriptional regulator